MRGLAVLYRRPSQEKSVPDNVRTGGNRVTTTTPAPPTWAHPDLSRFDPLPRILCYDDFDHGLQGWTGLIGNYEDTLDRLLPGFRDLRPPMLSNLTAWDTG